ncbi:MAG: type II secretion system F family protein [Myxococcales bacterium]|nr:type II secretion system F family protein [Myxococcales bacterium]
MVVLISILSFLTVSFLVGALGLATHRDVVHERLARLRHLGGNAPFDSSVLLQERSNVLSRFLARLGRRVDPSDPSVSKTRKRLIHAGYRRPGALQIYFGLRLALAVIVPIIVANLPFYAGLSPARAGAAMALAAGLGLVIPSFLLDRTVRRRQLEIEHALPDALDLMVVCVESGLGLTAGLARVAREVAASRRILAEELELVALEVQAGKSNVDALRALADRTGVAEVSSLAAMLIQTERFGTSIADALRVHADAMRRRRIQIAEEAAAKAPVKMLFPAGALIFPATLIFIAGPGILKLISALTGQ